MRNIPRLLRFIHLTRYLIIALLAVLIVCTFTLFQSLKQERELSLEISQVSDLAYQMLMLDDYLTDRVRKYVVTTDPVYMKEYWYEVNIDKRREALLDSLRDFKLTAGEKNYLAQAKRESDELINTEVRSMRLVLGYFQVKENRMPEAVQHFRLSVKDQQLSANDKLILARKLIFDTYYEVAKQKILNLVKSFNHSIHERIQGELKARQVKTRFVLIVMFFLELLGLILMFSLLRFNRRIYILEHHRANDDKTA